MWDIGANTCKEPEGWSEPLLRQTTHRARGSLLRVEKVFSPARMEDRRETRGRLAAAAREAQPLRQAAAQPQPEVEQPQREASVAAVKPSTEAQEDGYAKEVEVIGLRC